MSEPVDERQPGQAVQEGHDTILGSYHKTRRLWQIAITPASTLYVPSHDQCCRCRRSRQRQRLRSPSRCDSSGSNPKAYMGMAKIDVATGEMKVIYSQPGTNGSASQPPVTWCSSGSQPASARLDADSGKVLWERSSADDRQQHHHLRRERQAVRHGVHRHGAAVTSGPLALTRKAMPPAVLGHDAIYVPALKSEGRSRRHPHREW